MGAMISPVGPIEPATVTARTRRTLPRAQGGRRRGSGRGRDCAPARRSRVALAPKLLVRMMSAPAAIIRRCSSRTCRAGFRPQIRGLPVRQPHIVKIGPGRAIGKKPGRSHSGQLVAHLATRLGRGAARGPSRRVSPSTRAPYGRAPIMPMISPVRWTMGAGNGARLFGAAAQQAVDLGRVGHELAHPRGDRRQHTRPRLSASAGLKAPKPWPSKRAGSGRRSRPKARRRY